MQDFGDCIRKKENSKKWAAPLIHTLCVMFQMKLDADHLDRNAV